MRSGIELYQVLRIYLLAFSSHTLPIYVRRGIRPSVAFCENSILIEPSNALWSVGGGWEM